MCVCLYVCIYIYETIIIKKRHLHDLAERGAQSAADEQKKNYKKKKRKFSKKKT
jgi:hypothetical protein